MEAKNWLHTVHALISTTQALGDSLEQSNKNPDVLQGPTKEILPHLANLWMVAERLNLIGDILIKENGERK